MSGASRWCAVERRGSPKRGTPRGRRSVMGFALALSVLAGPAPPAPAPAAAPVDRSPMPAVRSDNAGREGGANPTVDALSTDPSLSSVEGLPSRMAAQVPSVPYNAKFTFTRIRYGPPSTRTRGFGGRRGFGRSSWSHDYPDADRNMQAMLNEFTTMRATTEGTNVFDLEDRAIFSHPILYISEPGFWGTTEVGAANLREYLLKGGFLIFDDFEAEQWYNMAARVAEALPEGEWVEIDEAHPIFSTFFHVDDIYVPHPLVDVTPVYRVIFEDNDPTKRIMVLANHNSDLAEYWEYAATGYFPVDPTNDAFRLGINYLIYGVTH